MDTNLLPWHAPTIRTHDAADVVLKAIAPASLRTSKAARTATITARAAVAVFTTAYDDWVDDAADLHTLMQRSLAELRQAVGRGGTR